jgi:hypothetical protein
MVYESGDWLCGGELEVMERVQWHDGLDEYRLTPMELRARFRQIEVRHFSVYRHHFICFYYCLPVHK